METSKLLDPNLDYYIVHNINRTSNIEDQEHNIIGKIQEKGFVTKHILLLDSAGSQICKIDKKTWSFTNTYEVKDSEGKILGIVKKKSYKFSSGRVMENSDGNIILSNHKSYDEKCTEIEDKDGKSIAKFCLGAEKKSFIEKYVSYGGPYTFPIHILDNSFDRKKLLCFFICLYDEMLEVSRASSSGY